MATREFTKQQVQEYLRSGGSRCPYCQSEEIEAGWADFEADGCWQMVHCLACGQSWQDMYQLVGIQALDDSGKPLDIR